MQYEQILKPPGVFEAENDPVLREKDERKRQFIQAFKLQLQS